MQISMKRAIALVAMAVAGSSQPPNLLAQRPVVPGTGAEIIGVADDFEDPEWNYIPRNPKSTEDIDEKQRGPMGRTTNGRWYEGIKRGHPDIVKRVSTPTDGLPESTGAMLLQSKFTGIPNKPSGKMGQDDFVANVQYRLRRKLKVSEVPSVTTRVFLPPVSEWENRTGPHFGFRLALETTAMVDKESGFGIFKRTTREMGNEIYWPGMFIEFENKNQSKKEDDYATIRIRGNKRGKDFMGRQITSTGWWTLGMSVTPDGMVHYYASPGVDELTEDDYITSQFPYDYRAERFRTFFYNVCSANDGKRWSTAFVVDDPKVFVLRPVSKLATKSSESTTR